MLWWPWHGWEAVWWQVGAEIRWETWLVTYADWYARYQPGPWFNIKMSSYQYSKSHCGDKTVVRSSYLHNGVSYTGKMTSLYWIWAQFCTLSGMLGIRIFHVVAKPQALHGKIMIPGATRNLVIFIILLLTIRKMYIIVYTHNIKHTVHAHWFIVPWPSYCYVVWTQPTFSGVWYSN